MQTIINNQIDISYYIGLNYNSKKNKLIILKYSILTGINTNLNIRISNTKNQNVK